MILFVDNPIGEESCTSEETRADDETEPEVSSYRGTVTQHGEKTEYQSICNGEKPYSCTTSGKAIREKSTLTVHNRINTGEKPYLCTTCGKLFRQKGSLTLHRRIFTSEEHCSCTTCGKALSNRSLLEKHKCTHTGENRYPCSTCEKSFEHRSQLVAHERCHTNDRPYSCTTCHKRFKHRGNLTIHERIHTGEKPYSCTVCDKSFTRSNNLAVHSLIHTPKKLTYSCRTCGKTFSDKKCLFRHERIHTGERPSTAECDVNELDNPTIESESDTSIDCSKTSKEQRSSTTNRIQNVAGFNQVVEVSDEVSRRDGSSYVHDQIRVGSVVQSDGEKRDSTEDTKVSDAEHRQSINIEGMYLFALVRYIVYVTYIKMLLMQL